MRLFLVFCFACAIRLQAQHQIGVEFSAGTSRISSALKTATTFLRPSANLGLWYQWQTKQRIFLSSGIYAVQIEGHEKNAIPEREIRYDSSTVVLQTYEGHQHFHLTYLSIPLLMGLKLGRFEPSFGIQTSYLIYGSLDWNRKTIEDGVEYAYSAEHQKPFVDPFDLGFIFRLNFCLSPRWLVLCQYYHGLNNIHGVNYWPLTNVVLISPNPWTQKIRQVTLGIRFSLWKKNTSEGTEN